MKIRRAVAVVALCAGIPLVALAGSAPTEAWGNGCIDGIRFPDEATYYTYLAAHPNAVEGVCPDPTTTTEASTTTAAPTTTEATPSTTTTDSPSTTTAPSTSSTEPSASSTTPPPSTGSVPPSTPETPTPPASSPTPPSTPGSTPPTASAAAPPQTPSSPTGELPSTGADTGTQAAIAAALVAAGLGLVALRRRAVKP